ncbi:MAG TPA: phosphotransferase [Parvularculaceae bacterium]|nr:phosphotransferase [Amphiplicatus sp.]MCB9955089.1 phosphotransferase [Caulobacterales bacterium]HPE31429.1 phosphotransferase [Parvularculaceae bacterium]
MSSFNEKSTAEQNALLKRLAREALDAWGLGEAEISEIKIRENAVYRVDTPYGEKLALRIHRGGYHSDESLKSELAWMEALHGAGVETPQCRLTTKGEPFVVLACDYMDRARQIDLFEWVEGDRLGGLQEEQTSDPATLARNFYTLGMLAGRVHNQSSQWRPPAFFQRHAWNAEGLAGETPLWGRFWELEALSPGQRSLMNQVRRTVFEELTAYGESADRYGLIHADLVAENVLVDDGKLRIIDFDDCGYGWFLFELATSLYFNINESYFDDLQSAVIDGYRSVRPLSDRELDYLPLFMLARSTTYLGWVHTRAKTKTAEELTPMLVGMACSVAESYFSR